MSTLPLSLKYKLANHLHKDVMASFELFKQVEEMEEKSFLSWVGHRLVPRLTNTKQYLYQETDEMQGFFFIKEGKLAFVLACQENAIFDKVEKEQMVGFEDYVYILKANGMDYEQDLVTLEQNRLMFTRKFTVITLEKVEALELPIDEVIKIQQEFPAVANKLYEL